MKRILLIAGLVLVGASVAGATVLADGGRFTLGSHLFVAGESVVVDEDVQGDLYAAGDYIRIKGIINGDLFFAGRSVVVDGEVKGALRGAGEMVQVNGSVGRLTMLAGRTVGLNEGLSARSVDVMVAAGDVSIDRPVDGDLAVAADIFHLNNVVGGTVSAAVATFAAGERASVVGAVDYYATDEDLTVTDGFTAVAAGPVTWHAYEAKTTSSRFWMIAATYKGLTVLLFGLLIYLFWPRLTTKLVELQRTRLVPVLLAGILFIPALATLSIMGFVSVILAGLVMLVWVSIIPLITVGVASVFQNVGQELTRQSGVRRGWAMVAGGLLLTVLMLVPGLSGLVGLIVFILAAGSVTIWLGEHLRLARRK